MMGGTHFRPGGTHFRPAENGYPLCKAMQNEKWGIYQVYRLDFVIFLGNIEGK